MEATPPKGTRDFLPAQIAARGRVLATVRGVFESFGYAPLETPAVERLEVLTGKYGDEADQLIFRILKRGAGGEKGEADLGLRYDLTVPLARVMAAHRDLPLPFKRYQLQPVWRAERPQKGRFREFYQCDVDCVGSPSVLADAEVIAIAHETLNALGFADHVISVNHRQILSALMDYAGVPGALKAAAIRAIDKRDKVGRAGVSEELAAAGVPAAAVEKVADVVFAPGAGGCVGVYLNAVGPLTEGSEEGRAAAADMQRLAGYLDDMDVPESALSFDLHMARGLDYYTGPIFEAFIADAGVGSVAGGGRYDHLIRLLGGPDLPATGVSLGLERIFTLCEEREQGKTAGYAQVLVAVYDERHAAAAVKLGRDIRGAGFRCEVYADPKAKLAKQFTYADAKGIAAVAMVGPDELDAGTVAVKDLRRREQRQVPRDDVPSHLRALLAE